MKERNLNLNDTCIPYENGNKKMQDAILKYYNDNGYDALIYTEIEGTNVIGVLNEMLGYWSYIKKFKVITLPKEYYEPVEPIINMLDNISKYRLDGTGKIENIDIKNENSIYQFVSDYLFMISIEVQNELLIQCKKANLDDFQTDLLNESIGDLFSINKSRYYKLMIEKINKK